MYKDYVMVRAHNGGKIHMLEAPGFSWIHPGDVVRYGADLYGTVLTTESIESGSEKEHELLRAYVDEVGRIKAKLEFKFYEYDEEDF